LKSPLAAIEQLGDKIEEHLPGFLNWENIGDPASWVQHWLISGAVRFAVGHFAGDDVGRHFAFGLYFARELFQSFRRVRKHGWAQAFRWHWTHPEPGVSRLKVGWLGDGIGDMAGPTIWLFL
jgi:hypothetical protein